MSVTSDILFAYLREMFYSASSAKLDIENLEEDYVTFGKGLMYFAHCFAQYNEFADALARGDLSVAPPPPENELAAPLKSLQANLKHLTWQSQQVAKGDYKQRIDFMGEFADAFNMMVEQLADRQEKLENEITLSQKRTKAVEQSNLLLSKLTQYIPEQIFVVSADTYEILLINDMAKQELENDSEYIKRIMKLLPENKHLSGSHYYDVRFVVGDDERYLSINLYQIEWDEKNALALVINDVSVEKRQLKELEDYAYRDALTQLYNRFYGMMTLNELLDKKERFALIFVDLDNLKYVNDIYGHNEGDRYITSVAGYLQSFSRNVTVCRLGGDEFLLLVPNASFDDASFRMEELQCMIQNDEYTRCKDLYYSISFGIVAIDVNNELSSSDILSIADERMYAHKRARKKERQVSEEIHELG